MSGLHRFLRLPAWAWPLLALPVVGAVQWWTYRAVSAEIRGRLEGSLRTMITANAAALGQWLEAEADLAEVVASDPRVREDVASLLDLSHRTAGDAASLRSSPAQARLRSVVAPVVSRQENAGFFVLDPGGLIVARIVDDRIGERVGPDVADAAGRALAGGRAFLPPTGRQRFSAEPMAFLMVPVRDRAGVAVAALALRLHPRQMTRILNASPLGRTGETYAIDASGRMVTESRFPEEVARLGLVPSQAGGRTTALLDVRDPGVRLAAGETPSAPQKTWPPTWAVAEAVAGRSGAKVDGYRDYRGGQVVGAWVWMSQWGIGLVTELGREEAYGTLGVVRRAFRILAAGLLLVAAAIALSSRRIYGLQKEVARTQRLGQYTLEDKIGEGGMGAVYRARHAFLRRPTAVKLVRAGLADESMLARFEREVQLTSQLTHPNTVAIYDYGRTPEGIFYYAMEYLPGLPLERVIADDGPQPEARVVHLVKQICASLAEAHRMGLVHRDVKPANVMLCERGGIYDVVKVLDFGLVKDIAGGGDAGVTEVGHIVGTPHFMAPEAVAGADHMGAPADVYAVGAVAYGLLTGQRVFGGKSGTEIIGHHLHTPPVLPSERLGRPVDPFLERLVLACLAKRPEERPGDAAALLRRLDEGWTGPAWTQDEARQWWETRAPAMLQSVRAAERSVSRGRNLAVDVASRVRSDRLPELELEDDDETALRPVPGSPPADGSK